MKPLVPPLALLSESLWALQTPELTAYVLTLTLLSSERRRHSRSRSRRGHRRPLLLLGGGGRERAVVEPDVRPLLVSRLTAVPSSELASVQFAVLTHSPLRTWAWALPRKLLASVLTSMRVLAQALVLPLASLPSLTESHGWRAVLSGRGVAKVPL